MRARSLHFVISGAVGGLAGFVLMEAASGFTGSGDATRSGNLVEMGVYFAGFGLAVGAALGMTEGFVRKNRFRLWYGLVIGVILGGIGGFTGGVVGQAVYGLVPLRYASQSNVDLVIALDSSGSMGPLLLGNDPWGRRKTAARRLVDRLSSSDRVAIVDFDERARVRLPLTPLAAPDARRQARRAIGEVNSAGGTSLDAGLLASFSVLEQTRGDNRDKHVIFLTDGQGEYTPEWFSPDVVRGVTVHTVGLGDGVDAPLLSEIASSTGGAYYPVSDASDLIAVFDSIFSEHVAMTATTSDDGPGELLTPAWVLLLLRILSWGIMGAAIGMGQGVTYNTREDFKACSWGGLIGGLIGGGLFDPVSEFMNQQSAVLGVLGGATGRATADLVVGAAIGGSMKLAQGAIVDKPGKQTTTLLYGLPARDADTDSRRGKVGRRSKEAREIEAKDGRTASPTAGPTPPSSGSIADSVSRRSGRDFRRQD